MDKMDRINKINEINNFNNWFNINKIALEHLYNRLILISKKYGYKLYLDQNTMNDFIRMMYEESEKKVIDKDLYPEFFNKKYNSPGYENYNIT